MEGVLLTAGRKHEEFHYTEDDPIAVTEYAYEFETTPGGWPVLLYNVTVSRSWQPYARGYIFTQVFLNLVGFSAFWLPPSCGERMSLSITSVLSALAAEIVVSAKLPVAAEWTWFTMFTLTSTVFAIASLLESVIVLYFYYKCSEDIGKFFSLSRLSLSIRKSEC